MTIHLSQRGAKSGYMGVYRQYRRAPQTTRRTPGQHPKWIARINHPPGQLLYLGVYPTALAAARKVGQALTTIRRQPGKRQPRTHCRWGHVLLTDRDVYIHDGGGYTQRACKRCVKQRMQHNRQAARARRLQE